jgi:hypothetical protein
MHEVCIVVLVQPVFFEMAFIAVFPGNDAVAHDDLAVALVTVKPVAEDRSVIVPGGLFGNKLVFFMAVAAVADLRVMFAFFKMADEATAFGDRDVLTLDDLRMAARAAEFLSPFEVAEVDLVIESDLFETHLAFENPLIVAAFLKAVFVLDFRPGLGFEVELGPVAADHDQALHLGPKSRPQPRRIMADFALNLLVGRGLPALEKRLHIMTDRTELRG